jgi:tRNA dimethylallyltransferase
MWPLKVSGHVTRLTDFPIRMTAVFTFARPHFRAQISAFSDARLCWWFFFLSTKNHHSPTHSHWISREYDADQMLRQAYRLLKIATMARKPPKNPLLVVVGATGTGKSQVPPRPSRSYTSANIIPQLAVELATRFNGEIINGDAMQMYDGLPIITNKITAEEQNRIPHHLLGFIALDEESWRVGLFKRRASQVIREIRSRGRLPILVGGTNYYTQSLLIEESLVTEQHDEGGQDPEELSSKKILEKFPILDAPTEAILERLKEVDPVMAGRWHPKDRRKIQRSLEIFLLTGKRASDIYMEQKQRKNLAADPLEGEDISDSPEQDTSPLVFWLHAEAETLKTRLNTRVDKMLQAGLLNEVKSMDSYLHQHTNLGQEIDSSSGIWVSIGWKEFKPYLAALRAGTESQEKLDELLVLSLEKVKSATRQYANRQVRWIRLKLLTNLSNQNLADRFYLLDGTDLSHWSEAVLDPALDVTADFLVGSEPRAPSSLSDVAKELLTPRRSYDFADRRDLWVRRECEICHTVCTTEEQWQTHIQGRTHRRGLKKQRKSARRGRSPLRSSQSPPLPAEVLE